MTSWSTAEMSTRVAGFALRVTPGQGSVDIDDDSLSVDAVRDLVTALNEAATIAEGGAVPGVKEGERTTARIFRDGDPEPAVNTVLVDVSGDFWKLFPGGWVCDSLPELEELDSEALGTTWGAVLDYAPLIEFRLAR